MHRFYHSDLQISCMAAAGHEVPRKGPGEEKAEDQEGLELPVNPDQGPPLIPDEEGAVTVPA